VFRDPSVITRYLKGASEFQSEVESVHVQLWKNSNKQV